MLSMCGSTSCSRSGRQRGGKTWAAARNPVTPDGRQKCYKFQKGRCSGECGRVHICLLCNGDHPMMKCPKRPGQGRPAAAGR